MKQQTSQKLAVRRREAAGRATSIWPLSIWLKFPG